MGMMVKVRKNLCKSYFASIDGKKQVSDEDWYLLNFIYDNHPIFTGKSQDDINNLKEIYRIGGIRLLNDMYVTAMECKNISNKIDQKTEEINELNNQLNRIKNGEVTVF